MSETPVDRLLKALERKGWSQSDLSRASGIHRQRISNIIKEGQKLTREYAMEFAPHLNVTAEWILFGEHSVPIVGLLGSDCVVALFEQNENERVKMPSGGTIHTVAVEIRGGSFSPQLNGWIAYYEDLKLPPTDEMMGDTCVVCLAGGTILVKTLVRGRIDGRFDLWAPNYAPMQDVEVVWAAPVTAFTRKITA